MVELLEEHVSTQNRRFVVRLADGALVEAVRYRGDTLCVSCQVGCAVGCPFCASGAWGLARPLTLDELTGQVEAVEAREVGRGGSPLKRVTVSGIGEPLHNHGPVADFVAWCRCRAIRPSLTTSGGPVPRFRIWLRELPHNGITVSVHAGTEATRARAVPRGPALRDLFGALSDELPGLSRSRRRRVSLAYLVVADLNDGDEEIEAFLDRATPLGLDVHLFAYNPVPTSSHRPVSRTRYETIYARMVDRGLRVRMSCQARVEPNGGCGTLVALRPGRVDTPTRAVT
ncbi:MAG: radical SAM protein [Sandaracinaceae bacterium]